MQKCCLLKWLDGFYIFAGNSNPHWFINFSGSLGLTFSVFRMINRNRRYIMMILFTFLLVFFFCCSCCPFNFFSLPFRLFFSKRIHILLLKNCWSGNSCHQAPKITICLHNISFYNGIILLARRNSSHSDHCLRIVDPWNDMLKILLLSISVASGSIPFILKRSGCSSTWLVWRRILIYKRQIALLLVTAWIQGLLCWSPCVELTSCLLNFNTLSRDWCIDYILVIKLIACRNIFIFVHLSWIIRL